MLRIDLPADPKFSICRHARALIDAGTPPDMLLDIRRGETRCFALMRLDRWADLTVSEPDGSPIRFKKYQPFPTGVHA